MNAKQPPSGTENRKATYVDRLVQGSMIRRVIVHWIGYLMITTVVLLAITWMMDPFASRQETLRRFLTRQGPILAAALLLIPVFVYDTIRFTHRMVGPMVRVRRELRHLSEGKPAERVELRPDDFWQEVADEFNGMCDFVEPYVTNA